MSCVLDNRVQSQYTLYAYYGIGVYLSVGIIGFYRQLYAEYKKGPFIEGPSKFAYKYSDFYSDDEDSKKNTTENKTTDDKITEYKTD